MDKHVLPQAAGDVEQQPPEIPLAVVLDVPPPPLVDTELQPEPEVLKDVLPRPRHNLELPMLVLAFCLTAAIDIAIQSVQNRKQYPLTFHLVCLMMVFALASIVVAKYVHQNYPNGARMLENFGVLFGITSFFFAITMSFPIWLIYALSLLAILACNYPISLFS
ncbi:Cytoplasmic polyadenylation element-binding protein [Actinidia chinensis var. chinensis]|uniref:Cytoplasmic polyadenylation element-binding protein n=1 Tax=Actinidia chinensis var. chinensis TaxID=1590841 RepID=A0A2R6QHC4_ACTCC|nr:Cytoplasmic polyadenylation element-binding protein [Actinidia chinensis var. chinensis]